MTTKPKTEGTLLYPGVILYGSNILINPGPVTPRTTPGSAKATPRIIAKGKRPRRSKLQISNPKS